MWPMYRLFDQYITLLVRLHLHRLLCTLSRIVALRNGVRDETDALYRRVIRRNGILHHREIAVGIGKSDDRDIELIRFFHRRILVATVDDEQRARKVDHRDESAEAAEQILDLTVDEQALFLGVLLELARIALRHELLKAVDALANVLEIGESPSYPAAGDVWHADAVSDLFHDCECLVLAPPHEKLFAGLCQRARKFLRRGKALPRKFEVTNVGGVFGAENEGGGGGMTACARKSEVRSGIEQGLDIGCHVARV